MAKNERAAVADLLRQIGPTAFGSSEQYETFRAGVDDYDPAEDQDQDQDQDQAEAPEQPKTVASDQADAPVFPAYPAPRG